MKQLARVGFVVGIVALAGCSGPASSSGGVASTSSSGTSGTASSDAADVAAAKAALDVASLLASGDTADAVTQDLSLPSVGARGVSVEWFSANPAIDATGKLTRPALCGVDATGALTALLHKGSASDTKSFELTVLALGHTDAEAVSAAASALALDVAPNAGLDQLTSDFALPAAASCGVAITWTSDSSALELDAAAGMAHVHRTVGARATPTLTATLSRGSQSASRTFALTVLAWGFTAAQFDGLMDETSGLDQLGGLIFEVQEAQRRVTATPSLIADDTTRSAFLAQDATTAAAQMCTTVARYMYLRAYAVLDPQAVPTLPTRFWAYYVDVVNKGYVGTCAGCSSTFVWVNDGTKMISDYVTSPVSEWSYDRGTSYPSDADVIAAMKTRGPQITLFRDGPDSTASTHTFLVALHEDGVYRMLDTYFLSEFTGKSIDPDGGRFGPGNPRYLFSAYGYVPTEITP